jgi:hypothetical protein
VWRQASIYSRGFFIEESFYARWATNRLRYFCAGMLPRDFCGGRAGAIG